MGKMRSFLGFFVYLFIVLHSANSFADGYMCTNAMNYQECAPGFYLDKSGQVSTNGTELNICRPCSMAGDNCVCPGGKQGPICDNTILITYDLNGGQGEIPEDYKTCQKNQTCNLPTGDSNNFLYNGRVFKGWGKTANATNTLSSIKSAENITLYAIWEACPAGSYKPLGANAAATCSSCQEGTYSATTGAFACIICINGTTDETKTTCSCNDGYLKNSNGVCTRAVTCEQGQYLPAGSTECAACPQGKYCANAETYFVPSTEDQGITDTCPAPYNETAINGKFGAKSENECSITIKDGYYLDFNNAIQACEKGAYGKGIGNPIIYNNGTDLTKYNHLNMCQSCPTINTDTGVSLLAQTESTGMTDVTKCYIPANTNVPSKDGSTYHFKESCYADLAGQYSCTKVYTQCKSGQYLDNGECKLCDKGYACDGINKVSCDGNKYSDASGLAQCKSCDTVSAFDGLTVNWDSQINTAKSECSFIAEYSADNGTWVDISCAYLGNTYKCMINDNITCTSGYAITSPLYEDTNLVLSSDNFQTVINSYCVKECTTGYTLDKCDDNLKYAFGVCRTEDGLASGYTLNECATLTADWSTPEHFLGNGCAAGLDNGVSNDDRFVQHTNQCIPNVYKIILNNNGGNGGYGAIYEKYNTGFYSDDVANNKITAVTIPTRNGYDFIGYKTAQYAVNNPKDVINANGTFAVNPTFFTSDNNTVYAWWGNHKYNVVLNNGTGATGGETGPVAMKYDGAWYNCENEKECSTTQLAIPERAGYTFNGYYYGNSQIFDKNGQLVGGNTFYAGKNGDEIELTAKWVANTYTITLTNLTPWNTNSGNNQRTVYLCYGTGWYEDKNCEEPASLELESGSVSWEFLGTYNGGKIDAKALSSTAFTENVTLTADWTQPTVPCQMGKYYNGSNFINCPTDSYCPYDSTTSVIVGTQNACQPVKCPTASTVHSSTKLTGITHGGAAQETECFVNPTAQFTDNKGTYTCTNANYNGSKYNCTQQYESCASGHYLKVTDTECPDGYTARSGVCGVNEGVRYVYLGYSYEGCMAADEDLLDCWNSEDPIEECSHVHWYGDACIENEALRRVIEEDVDLYPSAVRELSGSAANCLTCPDGYTCDGGTAQPYVGACEPGYTKHMVCPAGYADWGTGCAEGSWNDDGSFSLGTAENNSDKEECLAWGNEWFNHNYCVNEDWDELVPALVTGPTCGKCPAGYLCAGGDAAAATCPAGSYCAESGASVATGKCNVGTYSTGGATSASCTTCPATGLKDKDGNIVVATTASNGSTSASACFISQNVSFQDGNGTYSCGSNANYNPYTDEYTCNKQYSACAVGQYLKDGQCEKCADMPYSGGTFGLSTDGNTCPITYNKYVDIVNGQMYISTCNYNKGTGKYVCHSYGIDQVICDAGYRIDGELGEYLDSSNKILENPKCVETDPGYYQDGTGDEQKPCDAGTYQDLTGQSACKPADPGYYVSGEGATAQTPCNAATYSSEPGAKSCKSCGDAASIIGITSDMINSITGGETCTYDVTIYGNNITIADLTCELDGMEPGAACKFGGDASAVSCDQGYYMSEFPTSDCTDDGNGGYDCSELFGNISDFTETFKCAKAPQGTYSIGGWNAIDCPDGYKDNTQTGLSDQGQCQMKIKQGYYVPQAKATQTACPMGSYCPEYDELLNYGKTTVAYNCNTDININNKYKFIFTSDGNASSKNDCYVSVGAGMYIRAGTSVTIDKCELNTARNTATKVHYDASGANGLNGTDWNDAQCAICDTGYYVAETGAVTCQKCPDIPYASYVPQGFDNNAKGETFCPYVYNNVDVTNGTVSELDCAWDIKTGQYLCDAPTANVVACSNGWQLTNTGSSNWTVADVLDKTCSTPVTYEIKYMLNGGQNYVGAPLQYTHTVGATVNGTPERDGYYFQGWCTDTALTNCATTYNISADKYGIVTLYAKWGEKGTCVPGKTYTGFDIKECGLGMYCDSTNLYTPGIPDCAEKQCPFGFREGTGVKSQAECWKTCDMAEHAIKMSGQDFYGNADTCAIVMCEAGWTLENGKCVKCPAGSYCDISSKVPYSCETETGTVGAWSATGSDSINDCYITCDEKSVEYGTAHPVAETVYWNGNKNAFKCQYRVGTSIKGNKCDIINNTCVETSCIYDQKMGADGYCAPCDVENAESYLDNGGNCVVAKCVDGYHPNGDTCAENVVSCTNIIPNAENAQITWDEARGSFGECVVTECAYGYHINANACQSDTEICALDNGIGKREWDSVMNAWGNCVADKCDPGYSISGTGQCEACENMYDMNGDRVASSYINECEIATCMYHNEKYALENNECVPICVGSDETGTRRWDERREKCVHECSVGHIPW